MNNSLFYIPLLYLYKTRLKNLSKGISLIIIYVIPIVYLMIVEAGNTYSIGYIIFFGIFGIVALYNIYEIGYIQNDTETIKKESNPGIRLLESNFIYYEKYKICIYSWRFFLFIIFAIPFYIIIKIKSFVLFELSLLFILFLYQCYNRIRNRSLMLTYFFLISIRYISPLMLISEYISYQTILCILMINPIIKTISFKATKPQNEIKHNFWFRKYILQFDIQKMTGYRAIAYSIELIIALILYANGIFSIKYIFPILYMFLYRNLIWLAVKFKLINYAL